MSVAFADSPAHTLGVEWEFGLVDRRTRDLVNSAELVRSSFHGAHPDHAPRLHRELLRNTVEVVSGVGEDVEEVMVDLRDMVDRVRGVAADHGCALYCAGTHPFATWSAESLTPSPRYEELITRTQWWGRQMLIWGVHVHVGVKQHHVMPVISALLTWFPHLQALSASSPVWAGTDTGYASNRAMMFQQLPTAGLPFQLADWGEYERFVEDHRTTGIIDSVDEIRWDIRPAPKTGTIEVRVMDGISTFWEMRALVALVHCLVVDLCERTDAGEQHDVLPPWFVQENKWRAARYGLDAWVITGSHATERLLADDLPDLLARLAPVARRLGCVEDLALVAAIPRSGAAYARQRAVAERTGGDLMALVDSVLDGLDEDAPEPDRA
ncbi:glutamate--cysteine ligase [Nocardioidaceae bacterium]|nr:glutamate--cysteine ligase [Nocardioidaceae bacterium]